MKKMKKRFLAMLLTMVMVLSNLSILAFAADVVENQLKHSGYAAENGADYDGIDTFGLTYLGLNEEDVDLSDPGADFSYWHFVDSTGTSDHATFIFQIEGDEPMVFEGIQSTCNSSEKYGRHYAIITPSNWMLVGGTSYAAEAGQFNLSHSARHKAEKAKVKVTASVNPYHYEITPHEYYERTVDKFFERDVDEYYERTVDEYYERTVDKFYERTVDEYYERTVDEYYERTVDEFYERPVTEIYQRYAQRYLIPVFEKKLAGAYNDTMVTRLEYSDNTANAKPVNGGAFKNGHTYVAVDVAEASAEGGVWYTIADSSKNNGKKTPDQYNKPVDYQYNVKIADGKLTISCDERLAYAGVGAFVYATAPKDAKNAPKHYEGSVTVDLPKNCGDTVYLYTHFEKLGWYEVDEDGNYVYQFKEWRYDDSRTEYGDYEVVDTVYGDYALVETQYGEYELVDTVYGDYELVNTVYGEYELAKTEYGDYVLVDTQYGDYELVKTEKGDYELVDTVYGDYELVKTEEERVKVDDVYAGTLTLTVNGEVKPLNEEFELEPGTYTFTITGSGDEFEPVSKTVTVAAGHNDTVVFEPIVYQNADVTLDTVRHEADKEATEHYADREATRHEADREATRHEADKDAENHYADLEAERHEADKAAEKHNADKAAEKHYADKDAEKVYNEEYIYREDIKLGDEIDPDGEYAVKLN